jgi:hypothetical protein
VAYQASAICAAVRHHETGLEQTGRGTRQPRGAMAGRLLSCTPMAMTVHAFPRAIPGRMRTYGPRACGRERADGLWEGWIEFDATDGAETLRSERETTQPNLADLKYWATGLSDVYLEGVMARILTRSGAAIDQPPAVFDAPAPSRRARSAGLGPDAILDPYSVYAKSPAVLVQELRALRAWHLRQIIREYRLADHAVDLEALSEAELANLIVVRVSRTAGDVESTN